MVARQLHFFHGFFYNIIRSGLIWVANSQLNYVYPFFRCYLNFFIDFSKKITGQVINSFCRPNLYTHVESLSSLKILLCKFRIHSQFSCKNFCCRARHIQAVVFTPMNCQLSAGKTKYRLTG